MNFSYLLIGTGLSLLFLAIAFIPMELVFPAKVGQKIFRKEWALDLCYFLGQYLFWNGLVLELISFFAHMLDGFVLQSFRILITNQPIWVQAIEIVVISDFIIYWGHRLQHKVDFLWNFHKIHHSTEKLDWLAAHREHPLDTIYTVTLINLPALIVGFDLNAISIFIAFRGFWAIYIHSNVRLPIGGLKKIIGAPELHHWHHDLERDRGNYANVSPLMDILFGTYYCPNLEPGKFGIQERFSKNYIGQLFLPLLPLSKIRKKKFFKK